MRLDVVNIRLTPGVAFGTGEGRYTGKGSTGARAVRGRYMGWGGLISSIAVAIR